MDTKPILTVAETYEFLNIRTGTQDARIRRLISLATTSLELATGRKFTRQAMVEYLTTRDNQRTDYDFAGSSDFYDNASVGLGGMRTVLTPQAISLAGVNIDPASVRTWYAPNAQSDDDYSAPTALASRSFQVETASDTGLSRLHLYVATRFKPRALKITYVSGYEARAEANDPTEVTISAAAPEWLKNAAIIQAMFLNVKLRSDNIGMAAERTVSEKGKVATSQFLAVNGVTPEALGFIAHLRRAGVGRG